MSEPSTEQGAGSEPLAVENPYKSDKVRNYALGLLTVGYCFNFIDRQLLSILQEAIKVDLGLSDGQLGLLTGFAFAMFYVSAGIPIARWADKGNRRNIVSYAIGIWSLMTAISGLAMNYFQLFLARIGVGIGEAGGSPPSHSIISDIFPPEKRATAISIYSTGVNVGILFGFLFGGAVSLRLEPGFSGRGCLGVVRRLQALLLLSVLSFLGVALVHLALELGSLRSLTRAALFPRVQFQRVRGSGSDRNQMIMMTSRGRGSDLVGVVDVRGSLDRGRRDRAGDRREHRERCDERHGGSRQTPGHMSDADVDFPFVVVGRSRRWVVAFGGGRAG